MERRWSRTGATSGNAHTPDRDRHSARCISSRRDTGPSDPYRGRVARDNPGLPSRCLLGCREPDLCRGTALRQFTSDGHASRRALDRRRHPSFDRPTSRPRHYRVRSIRAAGHQQPLGRLTAPTRSALRKNVGPHLRHHRCCSHAGTTGRSPETARNARSCTRRIEASCQDPRARTARPGLHRRRLASLLGVPSADRLHLGCGHEHIQQEGARSWEGSFYC